MFSPEITSAQILDAIGARREVAEIVGSDSTDALRQVAKDFEATFLAEMLKHTGLGEARESFGGGPGEAAFSGMMTLEYAEQLSNAGGVGLADRIYKSLSERIER